MKKIDLLSKNQKKRQRKGAISATERITPPESAPFWSSTKISTATVFSVTFVLKWDIKIASSDLDFLHYLF